MDNHDDEQLEKMFAAQKTSFAEAVVYSQNLAVIAASRHACQKNALAFLSCGDNHPNTAT